MADIGKTTEQWEGLNSEIGKTSKLQTDVVGIPGKVTEEFKEAVKNVEKMNKSEEKGEKIAKKRNKSESAFYNIIKKTGEKAKTIAETFKTIATSIYAVGIGVAKFSILGGSLSGFLSLRGMRDLAYSAVSRQRGARGIGESPGRVSAFKTDYSRYVSPSMLNTISASQGSFAGRMWLSRSTGKSIGSIPNMKPTEIAQLAIMAAKKWWNSTPKSIRTQEYAKTKGFGQAGLSWEDIKRIGATSAHDLMAAQGQFKRDTLSFKLSDKASGEWYKLARQFTVSINTIGSTFQRKLSGLSGPLSDVVKSITKDFSALSDIALTPENIKSVGKAFHDAAEYLGSKEFINNIKRFGGAVAWAADSIMSIAKFFGYTETQKKAPISNQLREIYAGFKMPPLKNEKQNLPMSVHSFLYPNDVNINVTNGTGGDLVTSINGLGN